MWEAVTPLVENIDPNSARRSSTGARLTASESLEACGAGAAIAPCGARPSRVMYYPLARQLTVVSVVGSSNILDGEYFSGRRPRRAYKPGTRAKRRHEAMRRGPIAIGCAIVGSAIRLGRVGVRCSGRPAGQQRHRGASQSDAGSEDRGES